MGLGFNKFLKNNKKELKKKQAEQAIRLESIINEIQEVCSRRSVNYYEMLDILNLMQGNVNTNVAQIMRNNNDRINGLIDLLEKNNIPIPDDRTKQN